MKNIVLFKNETKLGEVKPVSNICYNEAFLNIDKIGDVSEIDKVNVEVITAAGLKQFELTFDDCVIPFLKGRHAFVQLTDLTSKDFTVKITSVIKKGKIVAVGNVPMSVSVLLVR